MITNIQELETTLNKQQNTLSNYDWSLISIYQKLSEGFVREFADRVDWDRISEYQKLSEGFIREFSGRVNWLYISAYQRLSEEFIREFAGRVDWSCISAYQRLSEEFVREFADRVNWDRISAYQKLSEEFMKEFGLEVSDKSWMYKDLEFKREYIKKNTEYELAGDFVIAYKSCRSDGYSRFNFQYFYEVGGTYECHSDCNVDNENSFGLSAWTREGALDYCKEKLFKVKIHLDDLSCLVHNNHKIRCSKLMIIEEIKI